MGAVMLGDYLAQAQAKTFRYGQHDCALFAARWVLARTGQDLTLGIRHTSLRDGIEQLRAAGFENHVAVAVAHLEEVSPLMARRGDIAAVDDMLGIVTGERIALLQRRGLVTVPITLGERAFRV
jgi:hypothetical protein